jgi:hypothetical protein
MKNQLKHLVLGIGEIAVAGGALSIAAGVSLTALMRLFDPSHWGLWVSPRIFMIGVIDDPNAAQEVLGSRIYPIALLVTFLGAMAAREAWAFAQDHWRHARRT